MITKKKLLITAFILTVILCAQGILFSVHAEDPTTDVTENTLDPTLTDIPVETANAESTPEPTATEIVETKISIDETTFPDSVLRTAVLNNFDANSDTYLDLNERLAATTLSISGISSSLGIEYLTNLTSLSITNSSNLTSLILDNNVELTSLTCKNTKITALDLHLNTKLKDVICSNNKIVHLNLGTNESLLNLNCSVNPITSLNLSGVQKLKTLYCSNTLLSLMDTTELNELSYLDCSYCKITQLNINPTISKLLCYSNKIAKLDLSKCINITTLDCSGNLLQELDVTSNTSLSFINCNYNQLSNLDLKNNTKLYNIYCTNNKLDQLIVNSPMDFFIVRCANNNLSTLDLTLCTKLILMDCSNNKLTSLNLSKNTSIRTLYCNNNQLESLDLSNNLKLDTLNCSNNHFPFLDFGNRSFTSFTCETSKYFANLDENNQFDLSTLPGFDISKMSNLTGGSLNGTILTAENNSVTYEYQVTNGVKSSFTIYSDTIRIPQSIQSDSDTYTKTYGDSIFNLNALSSGDGILSYASNQPEIVAVDSVGNVQILGSGTAVITVKAGSTTNYKPASKTITINVSKAPQIISIEQTAYLKTYGDSSFGLDAKTSGSGSLIYRSSNSAIASVSNTGQVTIKGAGTAVITITASTNANYLEASKTVTVNIRKASQSITTTASTYNKVYGSSSFPLGAKTTGNGTLTYRSSSTAIATVNASGYVTLKGCGKVNITISASSTTNYLSATKTVVINSSPKKESLSSVTSTVAKKMTIKWPVDSTVTGYQIQYSLKSNFSSGVKTITISKNTTNSYVVSGLLTGKKYYVRIRGYKNIGSSNLYGTYSSSRYVTIK